MKNLNIYNLGVFLNYYLKLLYIVKFYLLYKYLSINLIIIDIFLNIRYNYILEKIYRRLSKIL